MKKYVIYLLSLLMVFSPAAVFADVEAQADPGYVVEAEAELNDDAENAEVVLEQAEEVQEEAQAEAPEAAPEEAELVPVEPETVQAEAAAEATGTDHWEGNKYIDAFRQVLDELGLEYRMTGPFPKHLSKHSHLVD